MFRRWWDWALDHYVEVADGRPVGADLYYDPVVDVHHGRGPMGLVIPVWYLAPQVPEVARAGWEVAAALMGVDGGDIVVPPDPMAAVTLVQTAAAVADPATFDRVWEAAQPVFEPTDGPEPGERTFRFGLDEPHPRGQLNARAVAARLGAGGAWTRVFTEPDLTRFDLPTVVGVDFPEVAMAEARWVPGPGGGDAGELVVRPVARTGTRPGAPTTFRVTNVDPARAWVLRAPDGSEHPLPVVDGDLVVEVPPDGTRLRIAPR